MKNTTTTFLLSIGFATMLSLPLQASAQDLSTGSAVKAFRDLSTCFIDSLTGKERKELVKWIYFSMSAHPELESYANISRGNRQNSDKTVGNLITRLFSEDCPNEAKAALKTDPQALKNAFEMIGKVAIQDILSDKKVRASVNNYGRFVDQEKIKGVFVE